MTKRNIFTISLLFVFILAGCQTEKTVETAFPTAEVQPTSTPEPTSTAVPTPDPVGEEISQMTTEELVGQLLVVGIEGKIPGEDTRQVIEDLHVGGIILFGRNVESASQLTEQIGRAHV